MMWDNGPTSAALTTRPAAGVTKGEGGGQGGSSGGVLCSATEKPCKAACAAAPHVTGSRADQLTRRAVHPCRDTPWSSQESVVTAASEASALTRAYYID